MKYDNDNVFARILRGELPATKVYEDEHTFVMMDIMPESRGHLLVLTKEPAATLFDLSVEGAQACVATVKKIAPVLMRVTQADGMIFSQFNHRIAGQTVFHVHFHLVPCYEGVDPQQHGRVRADMQELNLLAEQIAQQLSA